MSRSAHVSHVKRQKISEEMNIRTKQRLNPGMETTEDEETQSEQFNNQKGHSHSFQFKFDASGIQYTIQCNETQTVFEAINSKRKIGQKIKCGKNKIILEKGEKRRETAIATHFPCICLEEGELVTLTEKDKEVEVMNATMDKRVHQDAQYFCVYIHSIAAAKTDLRTLFKNRCLKQYTKICVYGTKDMTLEDAIRQDGRFVELHDFELEDPTNEKICVLSDDQIEKYNGRSFRIIRNKNTTKRDDEVFSKDTCVAPIATDRPCHSKASEPTSAKASTSGNTCEAGPSKAGVGGAQNAIPAINMVSVSVVLKKKQDAGSSVDEILELLRRQFPDLKENLLKRMSSVEALQERCKEVNFGKAQQAFSEVGRIKKAVEMGNSVCVIACNQTNIGSGFMLFQNYILTNAHLFETVLFKGSIRQDILVTARFNYEEQHEQNIITFNVKNTFTDCDEKMDYAILELVETEENKHSVPPGLMKHCCPMPACGEACVIGHPKGGVKLFDATCIIEKENRLNQANEYLKQFENNEWALMSVYEQAKKQGIERIWRREDPQYEHTTTYHSFMYHGSSGSPVFDAHCNLFGMHTGGFTYGLIEKKSVIEYARSVLLIFRKFVNNLITGKNEELLKVVKEEFKEFPYWNEINLDDQFHQS